MHPWRKPKRGIGLEVPSAKGWVVAVLACVALAFSGCASVKPRGLEQPAVDVPASWSVADVAPVAGSTSLIDWWSRFDDPLLAQLIADALRANTSVGGAEAALRQARALRDVAAAALFPTLGSSASVQRSSGPSAAVPGGRSAINEFRAGLDANWELDIFGANRSALTASEATVRASAASLGDVQVSIAAEVALDYIALRSAQARLAIANENLASQQETLQITEWRLQAGLVTSLDTEQARTAVEQTAALVPALQTNIEQTSHAVAVLTGRPPAALTAALVASAPVPQAGDELALSIPAETLRQRADVRAAEHQVSAALARVNQAKAARLPNFSIGGSLGLNALTLGALTHGASVVSTLLGSVSLPVFDGGAARAQVDVQQAALDQARQVYRGAVLVALSDVENALVALRGDRVRLVRLGNAAAAAANAAMLARQQYSSGLVDFQTVLETQRTLLGTQDGVAGASADVSSDHVRLYKALGGGWTPQTATSAAFTSSRNDAPAMRHLVSTR
ncbi:MAG TPA: efflux transporter outer membrane subunit [Caldimonas sp.]